MGNLNDSGKRQGLPILPQYTYVPGITPHPASDERGHSFGKSPIAASGTLRGGRHLFNQGYYWEAHEVWETEWLRIGRKGPQADFIKGLIKLAACGVKCLEGNSAGAARHVRRTLELFEQCQSPGLGGIDLPAETWEQLIRFTRQLVSSVPLATPAQQLASTKGGVPLLGSLPDVG